MSHNIKPFDALPDSAFIREAQLVQSPKRPDTPAPLPFSPVTLWRKCKAGTFPAPVKLSERVTAWNVGQVRAWMAAQTNTSPENCASKIPSTKGKGAYQQRTSNTSTRR